MQKKEADLEKNFFLQTCPHVVSKPSKVCISVNYILRTVKGGMYQPPSSKSHLLHSGMD